MNSKAREARGLLRKILSNEKGAAKFRENGRRKHAENSAHERDRHVAKLVALVERLAQERDEAKEDSARLDYLQGWLGKGEYTGKCIVRESTSHKGFRMSETSWPGAVATIREAIDNARKAGLGKTEGRSR